MNRQGTTHIIILSLIILLESALAHAHGEDRPGPHGGAIRMPGAFHTEVKAVGKSKLKIYLLDMNWKNPSTRNSVVKAVLNRDGKETPFSCTQKRIKFICSLPRKDIFQPRDVVALEATREGVSGISVSYEYPFGSPKGHGAKPDEHPAGH